MHYLVSIIKVIYIIDIKSIREYILLHFTFLGTQFKSRNNNRDYFNNLVKYLENKLIFSEAAEHKKEKD